MTTEEYERPERQKKADEAFENVQALIYGEVPPEQMKELIIKAAKWDALAKEMDEFYAEDSNADLYTVGEAAALAFGYI